MLPNQMEAADIPASQVPRGWQSSRRHDLLVLAFAVAALTLGACGASGSTNPPPSRPSTTSGSPSTPTSKPSVALPSTTTPTTEAPTTNLPPTTTPTTTAPTTVPPSTEAPTTVPPTTTTTTEAPTTTVAPTTAPNAETSMSSTPWGWIVGAILLVAGLVVALALWLRSRSRRSALTAWRHSARPALQQAAAAQDLLSEDRASVDPERREDIRSQIEAAAHALDGLVTSAPDDASRRAASSSAAALRGLMFANEADRILRSREKSPTGDELAQSDEAQHAQVRELDVALEELGQQLQPQESAEPTPDGLR